MSKTPPKTKRKALAKSATAASPSSDFDEVIALIESARTRAVAAVNKELIDLYWSIGATISRRVAADGWGQGTVEALADHIRKRHPGMSGFSARNLWRMHQFYDAYHDKPKLSPLVRELSWTHNLMIFGRQVGGRDFILDLLCFNRALNCLVAFELKIDEFQPEHLGKLEFYLEALDRDARKPHEHPSIGVLLCATKDNEVVEYALSRSLSPALVAEYQTRLPNKKLLEAKLHEFYELAKSRLTTEGLDKR